MRLLSLLLILRICLSRLFSTTFPGTQGSYVAMIQFGERSHAECFKAAILSAANRYNVLSDCVVYWASFDLQLPEGVLPTGKKSFGTPKSSSTVDDVIGVKYE